MHSSEAQNLSACRLRPRLVQPVRGDQTETDRTQTGTRPESRGKIWINKDPNKPRHFFCRVSFRGLGPYEFALCDELDRSSYIDFDTRRPSTCPKQKEGLPAHLVPLFDSKVDLLTLHVLVMDEVGC